MNKYCDLHTHSVFSDGTLTPTELIALAERKGLAAVALTDHNTVSGLPEFLAAARNSSVAAVPGVEFSTEWEEREVHIVALFVKEEAYSAVTELTDGAKRLKEISNQRLVRALKDAGYDVDLAELRSRSAGQFNRAHVAARLVELGAVADRAEAFNTLLSPKGGFYEPPKRLGAVEVIKFIRDIGAVPVLAHPFFSFPEEEARRLAKIGAEVGLMAMETLYSTYTPAVTEKAEALARELSLLPSGGSDFHGDNKPGLELGSGYGSLAVPCSVYEGLLRAVATARRI